MQVLLASHNQELYRATIDGEGGIAELLREPHSDSLAADREFNFWMAPALRPGGQILNAPATALFLALSAFNATRVPLLRGAVVITTHTAAGSPCGLTPHQFDRLTRLAASASSLSWLEELILHRRLRRALHADLRRRRLKRAEATERLWREPWLP